MGEVVFIGLKEEKETPNYNRRLQETVIDRRRLQPYYCLQARKGADLPGVNGVISRRPESEEALAMANNPSEQLIDEIEALATQLDGLVQTCSNLRAENEQLREAEQTLAAEKADLITRNLEAKRRIDLVVDRLRSSQAS